jgi:hypothetical protein
VTHPNSATGSDDDGVNLRLVWPQWQGGGTSSVRELASEFPFDAARRGYAVGSAVLEAVLPPHDGPSATVPVTMSDAGLEERGGVEAKTVILEQLAAALEIIGEHDPARITTLGGECSVSVAPFSELARRYGDDLAILWIDSHPDVGTPQSMYPGYHAMAVAALTVTVTATCWSCFRRPCRRTGSPWWGCTRGAMTICRMWPSGASSRSALTSSEKILGRCSTGSPAPAARGSPSTSTSTRSTATKSC